MIDKGKFNILGVMVSAVDYEAATTHIIQAAKEQQSLSVTASAVHGIMTGALDLTQRYRLNHLDMILPDGMPVRWALNLIHHTGLPDRVYGPSLMLRVCEQAAHEHLPIYLYGSKQAVLDNLANNLRQKFPLLTIADLQASLFRNATQDEKEEIIGNIKQSGARIVFVGLGCPRQEIWVYEHQHLLDMPIIAVGAAFDFHAGLLPQSPAWMQRLGLEWFYRLIQEPQRLWRRYVFLNPAYLALLLLQLSGIYRLDPGTATPPEFEIRPG